METYFKKKILDTVGGTDEDQYDVITKEDLKVPYLKTLDPTNGKELYSNHGHIRGNISINPVSADGTYNLAYTEQESVFDFSQRSPSGKVSLSTVSQAPDANKILINLSGRLFYKFDDSMVGSSIAIRNRLIGTIFDNTNTPIRTEKLNEFYMTKLNSDRENMIWFGYSGYHINLDFNYTVILDDDYSFEITNQIVGLTGSGLDMEAEGYLIIDERQLWKQ